MTHASLVMTKRNASWKERDRAEIIDGKERPDCSQNVHTLYKNSLQLQDRELVCCAPADFYDHLWKANLFPFRCLVFSPTGVTPLAPEFTVSLEKRQLSDEQSPANHRFAPTSFCSLVYCRAHLSWSWFLMLCCCLCKGGTRTPHNICCILKTRHWRVAVILLELTNTSYYFDFEQKRGECYKTDLGFWVYTCNAPTLVNLLPLSSSEQVQLSKLVK